ncbi:MAG: hypothetical protein HQK49_02465 [Oligoflexia bacterium]|nr:hypothetical protein [Oligoflexia bacterium]
MATFIEIPSFSMLSFSDTDKLKKIKLMFLLISIIFFLCSHCSLCISSEEFKIIVMEKYNITEDQFESARRTFSGGEAQFLLLVNKYKTQFSNITFEQVLLAIKYKFKLEDFSREERENFFNLVKNNPTDAELFLKELNQKKVSAKCFEFDNRAYHPKTREQKGGICWAYTSTDLLKEEICRRDREKCSDINLEPYDLIDPEKETPGADIKHVEKYLNMALQNGVCLEVAKDDLMIENLREKYNWIQKCSRSSSIDNSTVKVNSFIEEIREVLIKYLKKELSKEEIKSAMGEKIFETFYKRIFVDERCKKNRYGKNILAGVFSNVAVKTEKLVSGNSFFYDRLDKLSTLALASDGRSIGINISKPYPHSILIVAMRYNRDSKKCEVFLRNHRANPQDDFQGWHDIADIVENIAGAFTLTRKIVN